MFLIFCIVTGGTVVTTTGGELAGTIIVPADWVVDTELGLLKLDADKLMSITFQGLNGPESAKARPSAERK